MSDASMNENTTVASSGVATHQPLHILREAREAQGVHLAVLSVAMKVSVKKFEALEAGRFEELPGFTFARALAASACRHLKIDPEPVLAQIPLAESPRLGYAETSMDTPFHSPSVTGNRSVVWLSRPAALVAAALLVGVLLLVFWPKTKPSDLAPAAQPSADVLVSSPEPAQGGNAVASASPAAAPVPSTQVVASAARAAQAVPPPVAATPSTPATPATPASGALKTVSAETSQMSIRATSESWVEVSGTGGAVLLRRLLKTGEVVSFASPLPYNVLLGRVDAAEVTVRGQRFDTAPFARNSVARFEVK